MDDRLMPRYPIYIPSKGRWDKSFTAKFLKQDGVPFRVVVEPQEAHLYAETVGEDRLLVLPFRDQGCVIPARNWIKDHAQEHGHRRHWQLDDNMLYMARRWRTYKIRCDAGVALAATEDFVDRYENIAVAGLNYEMFLPRVTRNDPFQVNCHVYSCMLLLTDLQNRWRGRYNEDADYCLQVLADGWCTLLMNAFMVKKVRTMKIKGGNTDSIYKGDGRLAMARELEHRWPGVVKVDRRWGRPQHVVRFQWKRFDTPLRRRADLDLGSVEVNEYGMRLVQVAPEIKSDALREMFEESKAEGEDN